MARDAERTGLKIGQGVESSTGDTVLDRYEFALSALNPTTRQYLQLRPAREGFYIFPDRILPLREDWDFVTADTNEYHIGIESGLGDYNQGTPNRIILPNGTSYFTRGNVRDDPESQDRILEIIPREPTQKERDVYHKGKEVDVGGGYQTELKRGVGAVLEVITWVDGKRSGFNIIVLKNMGYVIEKDEKIPSSRSINT